MKKNINEVVRSFKLLKNTSKRTKLKTSLLKRQTDDQTGVGCTIPKQFKWIPPMMMIFSGATNEQREKNKNLTLNFRNINVSILELLRNANDFSNFNCSIYKELIDIDRISFTDFSKLFANHFFTLLYMYNHFDNTKKRFKKGEYINFVYDLYKTFSLMNYDTLIIIIYMLEKYHNFQNGQKKIVKMKAKLLKKLFYAFYFCSWIFCLFCFTKAILAK